MVVSVQGHMFRLWNVPKGLILSELLCVSQRLWQFLVQCFREEGNCNATHTEEYQEDQVRVSGIDVCPLEE